MRASRAGTTACAGLLCSVFALLSPACSHDGGAGGSSLHISLSFAPPGAAVDDVLWIAQGAGAGGTLQVDVMAQDISSEFDGFNLEILFDPLVARAQSVATGGVLDGCSSGPVLKADNVGNDNANQTGSILISESIAGVSPPGCTVSGQRALARITFTAAGRGNAPLDFVQFNGDPNAPSGTRLYRTQPAVPDVPVQLFDSGAEIDVAR
jgi:hypothetical protein